MSKNTVQNTIPLGASLDRLWYPFSVLEQILLKDTPNDTQTIPTHSL